MTELNGYRAARAMLDLPDPPTAFLASSMISGLGVRRAIEERGLRLGRDVSIIIHDDELSYLRNGDDVPIYTATRSSVREAGRQAAEMLLDIIAHPDSRPAAAPARGGTDHRPVHRPRPATGPEAMPMLTRVDFPEDFLFGAATAAYQIEGHAFGGAGPRHWDTFAATPGNVVRAEDGAIACDHYHRWPEDLDLLRAANMDAYRFSTCWARVHARGARRCECRRT